MQKGPRTQPLRRLLPLPPEANGRIYRKIVIQVNLNQNLGILETGKLSCGVGNFFERVHSTPASEYSQDTTEGTH